MAFASSSHDLVPGLEKEAQNLTVEKLKLVLRSSNLPVSGNKSLLVSRIKHELNRLAHLNHPQHFDRLRKLIQNPDKPPVALVAATSISPAYSSSTFGASPRMGAPNSRVGSGHVASSDRYAPPFGAEMRFVDSPFYEICEKISPQVDLEARETSRDTAHIRFKLRSDILDKIRNGKQYRVLLYCATEEALRVPAQITFPGSIEVRVNDTEIKANFKGLKNKPGTTRPADVTTYLFQNSHQENRIAITWALSNRKFGAIFQLVRQISPESLVEKLRKAKSITKASVLQEMSRLADDTDIVATSSRMSLKCPLSTLRIQTPCRSQRCRHNQCFDALSFIQLQEQAPQWSCPVCNQHVAFDILQVDEYVDDILRNSPQNAEQVTIEPNGSWSLITENAQSNTPSNSSVKREATELSDDLIEIGAITNGNAPRTPSTSFSPFMPDFTRTSHEPSSHSALKQMSQKRPAPAVIDLTLDSDDDDDLPTRPPAKRQQTDSGSIQSWSPSLSIPPQIPPYSQNGVRFSVPNSRGPLPLDRSRQR